MARAPFASLLRYLHQRLGAAAGPDLTDEQLLGRFARLQEEAAFEALVRRHGAMVWSVCRRLLSAEADVEDAFQATFLVLVDPQARLGRQLVARGGAAYRHQGTNGPG